MATSPIADAIAAYAAAAKAPVTNPAPVDPAAGAGSFVSMVQDAAKTAVTAGKQSEQLSASAIAGKADIREVVAAVSNAELTLETVVAVRDKVINAYNEILRMPI